MNILHMKYAVEVARAGSINKASEELYIAQPNLSRSIKELEADLGITIFDRSSRGMVVTPEGEDFIRYAKKILGQIDEIESMYKSGLKMKQHFSLCAPRATYISNAFAQFTNSIDYNPADIFYMETNNTNTINKIISSDYRLGIVRYPVEYDSFYKESFENKGLNYEVVAEFKHFLLMSKESELAKRKEIFYSDLRNMIEVAHGDPTLPTMALGHSRKGGLEEEPERKVFVFERCSQFDLLEENPETFMWVSPIPNRILDRYGLVMRQCSDNDSFYKDVLIYRKDYILSALDKQFITDLCECKRECIPR